MNQSSFGISELDYKVKCRSRWYSIGGDCNSDVRSRWLVVYVRSKV